MENNKLGFSTRQIHVGKSFVSRACARFFSFHFPFFCQIVFCRCRQMYRTKAKMPKHWRLKIRLPDTIFGLSASCVLAHRRIFSNCGGFCNPLRMDDNLRLAREKSRPVFCCCGLGVVSFRNRNKRNR